MPLAWRACGFWNSGFNPERVGKLALIDTALRFRDGPFPLGDSIREIRNRVKQLVDAGRTGEAKDHWLTAPLWQSPGHCVLPEIRQIVSDYFASPHQWDRSCRNTPLMPSQIPLLTLPTLVLVGTQDLGEFQAGARYLGEHLPDCEFHLVRDAGHIANMDNPGFVNDELMTFLKGR
jgi:pimeloyl-ACP methyl ester carboxylesterase